MRIIAGRWRGHTISAPPGRDTRPTTDRVREAWMSALLPELEGASVLDLFAGSGGLGLEALSRGARHVTFVERSNGALKALKKNIETLGAQAETTVVREDALRYAMRLGAGEFDVCVADPPYAGNEAVTLVELYLRTRFARSLWVEHGAKQPVPAPESARTRRYGDTLLTTIRAEEEP